MPQSEPSLFYIKLVIKCEYSSFYWLEMQQTASTEFLSI